MSNAVEPGWRPQYTGADLGNVGSGLRLGANLYYLYRAGRNELPAVASIYADLTRQIHGITGAMRVLFHLPGRGMDRAHLRLLELRDETHDILRQTCLRMQEAGTALVQTAERYTATDEAAAAEFARQLDRHADDFHKPPPSVPTPPGVHDSQPTRPVPADELAKPV